jgi:hypothetical protein
MRKKSTVNLQAIFKSAAPTQEPKKNYSEILKDPRWQKKRLEILESDEWRCRECLSKEKTLHIHHLYYIKDAMPWEYPDAALITLCHQCHESCHSINWHQAFLDLNMPPKRLLEIALFFQFLRGKHTIKFKEIQDKYKVRYNNDFIAPEVSMTESMDEFDEVYPFYHENKPKYING